MHSAYIGLGTNLGDRWQNLALALEYLEKRGIVIDALSSVYETEPQGVVDQPWFLNMAARIKTDLSPHSLLEVILDIEAQMGRVRLERWGPRIIDLDILLYEKVVLKVPDLQIPHPRLTERAFVLIPLLEIDESLTLPDGTLLKDYLPNITGNQGVRAVCTAFNV